MRDLTLNVRVTEAERDMAAQLAEREGLKMTEYIRTLLRRTYEGTFGTALPANGERKEV